MNNDRVTAPRAPRGELLAAAESLRAGDPDCPRCSRPLVVSADGSDRLNTPIRTGGRTETPVLLVCTLRAAPHLGLGIGTSGSRLDRVCDWGRLVGIALD